MFKKTEFSIIYEKSKKEWKDNLKLIIVLALIVGILSTTISLFSLFDFKSQGIDIFNPVVDLKNPVPITPTNSNYILYFSYLIQFITAMISMVSLIYFFKNAINKKISFSESFNYFLKKFIPLILTIIIFISPIILLTLIPIFYPKFIFYILPLYIPIIIFSVYFGLYTHSILFRGKVYFSAFAYSYNLIKDNWLRTLDNGVRLFFKVIFFLIVAIIISIIGVFMKNEIVYSIGILISNIIYFAYGFLFLIFTINYFLYLEKEKGISNELFGSLNENNFSKPIFPNEQQAKNYILEYKSQFSRESIKIGLKNVGMLDSEIDIYLNKYL